MPKPGREIRVAPYIYRTPSGWRVYVTRAGVLKPKRFQWVDLPCRCLPPADHCAPCAVAQLQIFVDTFNQETARLRDAYQRAKAEHAGTFAADADRYLALKTVRAMESYSSRVWQITFWTKAFGTRPRPAITVREINEQLQTLVNDGYAHATVNKFRAALMSLYTQLDGRGAANPVKDTRVYEEAEEEARGQDYALLRRILAAVPDDVVPGRGAVGPSKSPLSKVRLALMLETGMAPSQIGRLDPAHDFSIAERWYISPRRKKGKRLRRPPPKLRKPMTEHAARAFARFVELKAQGPFDRRALRRTWLAACRRVERALRQERKDPTFTLPHIRLYDIRHSFGTALLAETENPALVGMMMDHSSTRTTRRYTLAAVPKILEKAMRGFARRTSGAPPADGGKRFRRLPPRRDGVSRGQSRRHAARRTTTQPAKHTSKLRKK